MTNDFEYRLQKITTIIKQPFLDAGFAIHKTKKKGFIFHREVNGILQEISWGWGKDYSQDSIGYSGYIYIPKVKQITKAFNATITEDETVMSRIDEINIEKFSFHRNNLNGGDWNKVAQLFTDEEQLSKAISTYQDILPNHFIPMLNKYNSIEGMANGIKFNKNWDEVKLCLFTDFQGGGYHALEPLLIAYLANKIEIAEKIYTMWLGNIEKELSKDLLNDSAEYSLRSKNYPILITRLNNFLKDNIHQWQ
jgi:hypothetical protein